MMYNTEGYQKSKQAFSKIFSLSPHRYLTLTYGGSHTSEEETATDKDWPDWG